MAETLEQILARKSQGGGKTLEQILAEGREYTAPPDIAEPPPSGLPSEVEEMRAAGGKTTMQQAEKFAVPFVTTAIGGALGGLPGAMAGAGAGELITGVRKREGRIGLAPGTEERAVQSAVLAGVGEGVARLGIRGLGYLGRIKQKAITPVLRKGPIATIRAISKPGEYAERDAALAAAEATGKQAPALHEAEAALTDLDARLATAHARPSRQVVVDKINEMLTKRGQPANPEEAAANRSLERFKGFVPQFKSASSMHDWLTRIRVPIQEQLGKAGAPIHKEDLIELQHFVREYRDRLLGGAASPGAKAFAKASRQIQSAKELRAMFLDQRGNLKPGAEGTWRRVMGEKDHTFRRALESYDELTGQKLTQQATELAQRRAWNPEDSGNAVFILSIIARAISLVARGGAKTIAVIRPGVAPTVAGAFGTTAEETEE